MAFKILVTLQSRSMPCKYIELSSDKEYIKHIWCKRFCRRFNSLILVTGLCKSFRDQREKARFHQQNSAIYQSNYSVNVMFHLLLICLYALNRAAVMFSEGRMIFQMIAYFRMLDILSDLDKVWCILYFQYGNFRLMCMNHDC